MNNLREEMVEFVSPENMACSWQLRKTACARRKWLAIFSLSSKQ